MSKAEVVGVDIGGTFIDYVAVASDGEVSTHKELSDPEDLAGAFFRGLRMAAPDGASRLVHGTTVATNALLERRGARVALLATNGFADVIEIGRQNRPDLYALTGHRLPALVPAERRLDIPERVAADGSIVVPLDEPAVKEAARSLADLGVEAVAVSFLFSFLAPEHELRAAELLIQELGDDVFVCLSSDILPEYREYERMSTTVATAYVGPLLGRYLDEIATRIESVFQVMQSNGGVIDVSEATSRAAALVLSGPAGGVVGGYGAARQAGFPHAITFDMGGTSTDVALCPGEVPTTVETSVGGVPVRLPMIDIHTVGAGGGSIARVDSGGVLRVGPESAGANPGPAAYGKGTEPTVTDADLVLGRLLPGASLGGSIELDVGRARQALAALADELAVPIEDAALGVLRVAHASMDRAIRRVSVERGHDPREFTLVAFGGAGPMHAAELAEELGIRRVLIPPFPGVESAVGMATADEVRDFSRTVKLRIDRAAEAPSVEELWQPLIDRATAYSYTNLHRSADLRYVGQSFEIEVPGEDIHTLAREFDRAHERLYGFARPDTDVEIVNVRARIETRNALTIRASASTHGSHETTTIVRFASGQHPARVVARSAIPPEGLFGPALVVQADTTTVVPPDWLAIGDEHGHLLLEVAS